MVSTALFTSGTPQPWGESGNFRSDAVRAGPAGRRLPAAREHAAHRIGTKVPCYRPGSGPPNRPAAEPSHTPGPDARVTSRRSAPRTGAPDREGLPDDPHLDPHPPPRRRRCPRRRHPRQRCPRHGRRVATAGGATGTGRRARRPRPWTARRPAPAPQRARVAEGATAQEPKLYPDNQANAYGVLKDAPRLPDGSVHIETVFHVISDHALDRRRARPAADDGRRPDGRCSTTPSRARPRTTASDSPFRFDLTKTDFVVNEEWATVAPGQDRARHEGGALRGRRDDAQRLRGGHRRRPARLGLLPQGLQPRSRLHRRRRHPRRVDARRGHPDDPASRGSTASATPSPTRSATG